MPEFTFSDETLDAIEKILEDIFSQEFQRTEELQKINQALEEIVVILKKIGRTKGIDIIYEICSVFAKLIIIQSTPSLVK